MESTKFPDSFPIDIMYLLYENIPGYMFKHWYGCFFNNPNLNMNKYTIQKSVWITIGKTMEANKKLMPVDFGWSPRNIVKLCQKQIISVADVGEIQKSILDFIIIIKGNKYI